MPSTSKNTQEAFEWGAPPSDARRAGERYGVWAKRVERLNEKPGEWALILLADSQETASTIVTRFTAGAYVGFVADDYELVWAKHEHLPDKFGVWGRRKPEEDDA